MGILSKIARKTKTISKGIGAAEAVSVQGMKFKGLGIEAVDMKIAKPSERISSQICEIGEIKQDLGKMTMALGESMRLNKGAMGEIDRLTGFMKTVELNTLSLERLEPENNNLKVRLEHVQSQLAKTTVWASELESKSVAYKSRFEEAHVELEVCHTRLLEQDERIHEQVEMCSVLNVSLDELQAEKQALLAKIEDITTLQLSSQRDVANLRDLGLVLSRENISLEKQVEALTAHSEDERGGRERSASDLKILRLDFVELKSSQVETASKLDKAQYALETSRNALAQSRQQADDRIFALNATIDGLQTQSKVNAEMSAYDTLEKTKLKAHAERDARRVVDMGLCLDTRIVELDENRAALADMKANYDVLNGKFQTLLSEMEILRGDNTQQSKKLEAYSSISGVAVGQSFYDDRARSPKLKLVPDMD